MMKKILTTFAVLAMTASASASIIDFDMAERDIAAACETERCLKRELGALVRVKEIAPSDGEVLSCMMPLAMLAKGTGAEIDTIAMSHLATCLEMD